MSKIPLVKHLLAGLFLVATLTSCNEPEDTQTCEPCKESAGLVAAAKKDISMSLFSDAIVKCEKAAELTPEATDPHYCLLIARVGRFTEGLNSILKQIDNVLSAAPNSPSYTSKVDAKRIIESYVKDLEMEARAIDVEVQFLAPHKEVQFQIPNFPLHIEVGSIGDVVRDYTEQYEKSLEVPSQILLNAGGTWDASEVLILGSLSNILLAGIDFVLAHDLSVGRFPVSDSIEAMVAEFFIDNEYTLGWDQDSDSRGRIDGDSMRKGLKNEVIAFLTYLTGRDAELAGAAGANAGLKETLKWVAANPATDSVIKWHDENGDGHPEAFESEVVSDLVQQIIGVGVPEFPTILSPATFDSIYVLLGALVDNLENKGEPAQVAEALNYIREDIFGLIFISEIASRDIPNLVAIDLNAYLDSPVAVRDLVPYYWSRKYGDSTTYGLMLEFEVYNPYSESPYKIYNTYYEEFNNWNIHFESSDYDQFDFGKFEPLADLLLSDDGVNPNAYITLYPYVALQSPSMGGIIHLNLQSLGGSSGFGKASHSTVNEAASRLIHYYCLNFDINNDYDYFFKFLETCP